MDKENSGKVRRFRSPEYHADEIRTKTDTLRFFNSYCSLSEEDGIIDWMKNSASGKTNDGFVFNSCLKRGQPINQFLFMNGNNETYIVTQKMNNYRVKQKNRRKNGEKEWHYLRYLEIESVPENTKLPKELSDKLKEFGYEELKN